MTTMTIAEGSGSGTTSHFSAPGSAAAGMESSLLPWIVGLAVSTGLFFITTVFLCILLTAVICRQRLRQRESEKTKDVVFEGCNKTSHWVDASAMAVEGDSHPKELPIWSVQTFMATSSNPASPPSTPSQSTSNTSETASHKPPLSPSSEKQKIVPKRVAPPPPKGKKKRRSSKVVHEAAEYAVPVTTHYHWYNWNKKKTQQKSPYKELDLSRVDNPTIYSKPNIPV